jgi:hypothetical protein
LPEPPIVWISSSRHALAQQYGDLWLVKLSPSGKCRGPRAGNINLATVAKVEWRYVSEDLLDSFAARRHDKVPLSLDVSDPSSATSAVNGHCQLLRPTALKYDFSAVLPWRMSMSRETGVS